MIPDRYKFKMLVELGQLISSAGISDTYKKIPQGKELQQWVVENSIWTYSYFMELYEWSRKNINMEVATKLKLSCIRWDLYDYASKRTEIIPLHAYFRYAKEYECGIPSKTLLPIDECIEQYKKYIEYKNIPKIKKVVDRID